MELEVIKKLIKKYLPGHGDFLRKAMIAKRYYQAQNDILFMEKKKNDETENPMRNADNRIAMTFYPLLVDQKIAYLFTAPPLFDAKNEEANQLITDTLGGEYAAKVQELGTNAANSGIGWLHYWTDENNDFQYGVVPSEQIIPVWSPKLSHELLAVLRVYQEFDDNGDIYDVYEFWDDETCTKYRKRGCDELQMLTPYPCFTDFYISGMSGADNEYRHNFGAVPFIPFRNNQLATSDLFRIKKLIDAYDKTISGFMNDLEDIQEVIFVLTNYGGEDLNEFLKNLKYYKTISVESAGTGDSAGVSTLNIDIPVEARREMMATTKKAIFTMGQGVDPEQQGLNSTSGEAMKFVYSLLELKAGQLETQFRMGFDKLIHAILRHYNRDTGPIIQTWTRTAIKNDADLVSMCRNSVGVVSNKTILAHHPFVDDVSEEQKELAKEQQEQMEAMDMYGGAFNKAKGGEA